MYYHFFDGKTACLLHGNNIIINVQGGITFVLHHQFLYVAQHLTHAFQVDTMLKSFNKLTGKEFHISFYFPLEIS
ncbi:hypothetical protein HMPREF0971_02117 [Segatella oris F0302]|uniref:Uncharacterized protein n=1 Tax=Segatella oris F0302 TaxID=649760 RepID=D1QSZ5_9BACT|nr:hypothetical protein HMPREF0971_02117 [Segatella oris F0302]